MRKAVSDRIGQDYTQVSRSMVKRQLLDKLPTPTSSRCRKAWSRRVQLDLAARRGSQEGRPEAGGRRGKDAQGVSRDLRAPRPPGHLLADVGRSNSIDVTPEELNQAVMREADALSRPGAARCLEFDGQERRR
jgi:trigger factor